MLTCRSLNCRNSHTNSRLPQSRLRRRFELLALRHTTSDLFGSDSLYLQITLQALDQSELAAIVLILVGFVGRTPCLNVAHFLNPFLPSAAE